jgi:hypothetical protein
MNIDSVTFTNEYGEITKPRLYGNVGDRITCQIDFTLDVAGGTYFRVLHNLIEDTTPVYQGFDFTISDNLFASIQTGEISGSQGTVGNLDFIQPFDNSATFSHTLTQNTPTTFTLIHEFDIQPYIQTEYDDGTVPDHFFAPECLKYIFKIEAFDSEFAGDLIDTTDTIDLSSYFTNHDTGGWNETFNGRAPKYTTNSSEGQLYSNTDSDFHFMITTMETFTIGTRVTVHLQEVTDTYDTDLLTAVKLKKIDSLADGLTYFMTGVGEITTTIMDTNLIQVHVRVYQGSIYDSTLGLWCTIFNNVEGHNNTPFIYSEAELNLSNGVYTLVDYPSTFIKNDFNFLYHFESDLSKTHNHIHGFEGDDIVAYWGIEQGEFAPVPDKIEFLLRSGGGAVLSGESFTITPNDLPTTIERTYERSVPSLRKEIFVEKVGNTFLFAYPFQLWETFLNYSNITLEVNVTYTIDGVTNTTTFNSVPFEIGNYGTTQNVEPESIALPTKIEYFAVDGAGTILGGDFGGVVRGFDTLIVAEWKDEINNDLEKDTADLVGWLGVNTNSSNQDTFRIIHTEYDPEGTTIWKQPQGHTPIRAQIVRVDSATAQVRAILKYSDMLRYFGRIQEVCISARLDSRQDFTFTTWEITFDYRSNGTDVLLDFIDYSTIKVMPVAELLEFFTTTNSADYSINGTPDVLPNFLANLASTPIGSVVQIKQTSTSDLSTSYMLKYTNGETTPSFSTITLPFATNSVAHTDAIVPFDSPIQIQYATMTSPVVRIGIRFTDSDIYSDQAYEVRPTGLPAVPGYLGAIQLNAVLAAIPDGTKYELHFWNPSYSTSDTSFNYTYLSQPTRAREATNTLLDRVNFLPAQNGVGYDGVSNQYLETDVISSLFDISEPSVQAFSIWFYKPEGNTGGAGYPNAQVIAESRTAGGDGWVLSYGGNNITTFIFSMTQGANDTVHTYPFASSFKAQWMHVVFQKNGALPPSDAGNIPNTTNWQFYVNGHRTRASGTRIYDPITPLSGQKLRLGGVPINANITGRTAVANASRVRTFTYRQGDIFTETEIRQLYHDPSFVTNGTDLIFDLNENTIPASFADVNGSGLNLIPFNTPSIVSFP